MGLFKKKDNVTKFSLPIEVIDEHTFENRDITSLDLSNCKKLRTIASGAFQNREELTEIRFPESLEKIGEDAFRLCDGLKKNRFVSLQEIASDRQTSFLFLQEIIRSSSSRKHRRN